MLQKNTAILWRELAGEAVLLDPAAGCSYNLNVVGTLIWKMVDGTHTPEDIAAVICAEYEVEREQALQDVAGILQDFQQNNLVMERVSASHPAV